MPYRVSSIPVSEHHAQRCMVKCAGEDRLSDKQVEHAEQLAGCWKERADKEMVSLPEKKAAKVISSGK